ncbi:MAG: DEAD/DEAH box helicase [Verrucomicrobiota bacterium]
MTTKLFSELGISPEVLKAIDKLGFEQAAPIQAEAIPALMQGRDVVGQSQTGSGKTAAFAVPAIEKVDPQLRAVQALILCPTRELAVQVSEEVHKLACFKRGVMALPIYGGQSYDRQFYGLRQGAQIVIGTPGRIMDHMTRGTLRLDQVKLVVLDEADVMLDMGFRDDIEFILKAVPTTRQTVFFSATMPRAIQELIQKYARDPQNIRIEQKTVTVSTVEQVYYEVDRRFKVELITRLIDLHNLKLGIIFCNTKRMVDDLVDHLNAQGYSADRLHGDMSQAMRDRVMNKFRKSGLEFLVATDVAARGIDVNDVEVVFNYDLPYDVEDYVHRIGRTGRAGRSGLAISFVGGREVFQIQNIERFTRMRIQRARVPTLDQVEEAKAGAVLHQIREVLAGGEYRQQEHLVELLLEEGFASTDVASALLHLLQAGDTPEPPARRTPADLSHLNREPADRPAQEPARSRLAPESRDARPPQKLPVAQPPPAPQVKPTPRPAVPVAKPAPALPAPVAKPVPATSAPVAKPATITPAVITTVIPVVESAIAKPAPTPIPKSAPPIPRSTIRNPQSPDPFRSPKHSRRTPEGHIRLYMNVGKEMGVAAQDVLASIQGETGLPATVVGTIDLRERHLFVDVAADHAKGIIAKLNRANLKGNKLKVKEA